MIVRLVLAAIVAAALLGAAMPAIDDARHDVSATEADRSAQAVADAITELHRSSDPVPRGVPGAKRVVTVEVPDGATIVIGSGTTESGTVTGQNRTVVDGPSADVVSYHAEPRTTGSSTVDMDVRAVTDGAVRADDDGLVVRETGRVVLRHELVDGNATVTVARLYHG